MATPVIDSTGTWTFDLDDVATTLTYNGPGGVVDTLTVGPDNRGQSYRQTFTYTGTNITAISSWVKQ